METARADVEREVGELFREYALNFGQWAERNWRLDRNRDAGDDSGMSQEQIDGWNKCVDSLDRAIEAWMGDKPSC
ncbi:MAG: hypothetical protein K0R85_167 [Devosia sp.]|jgi:hypothetical protein|nr:hypothetical protein [Devosia sp.]